MDLHPPPEQGKDWLRMQVEEKWNTLIGMDLVEEEKVSAVREEIENLKRSLYLGKDPDILSANNTFPGPLKTEWVDLLYRDTEVFDLDLVDRLIHILDDPHFDFPYRDKSKKSLTRLKAVAETMEQLEGNTNVVLREILNGGFDKIMPPLPVKKEM